MQLHQDLARLFHHVPVGNDVAVLVHHHSGTDAASAEGATIAKRGLKEPAEGIALFARILAVKAASLFTPLTCGDVDNGGFDAARQHTKGVGQLYGVWNVERAGIGRGHPGHRTHISV